EDTILVHNPLAIAKRIMNQNRVLALGTRRKQRDGGFDQLLDAANIFDRLRRQIAPRSRPLRRLLPSGKYFIDGFDRGLHRLAGGQAIENRSIEPIADADLN